MPSTALPMSAAKSSSRSMVTVNALLLASVGVGFLNNLAIGWMFGLTRKVDAFYAATVLPTLFITLCIDYLGKNFLPVFARARHTSFELASEVTSSLVTIAGLAAIGVMTVFVLARQPLFTLLLPGFDAAEIDLVSRYFLIMAPAVVLSAISPFHEYIYQHDDRYTLIVGIRGLQPVVNLAAVLTIGPFLGEYALPIAFTVSSVVVFVLFARGAHYRYRPRITMRPEWERKIFLNSAIVMASGLAIRARGLFGAYFSSLLGPGAISALNLGYKLVEPLERTTFTGVRMLMFSRTARLAVEENSGEISRLYRLGVAASFLLVAPPLAWMCYEGKFLVGVLFQRGAFDMRMTELVALAIIGFTPSVLVAGVNGLLSNAFYALDRVKIPALVMPLGTLAYLAVAPNVYKPLGVLGMALSPSVAQTVVFLLLLYFLGKQLPRLGSAALLLRVLGYSVLAAGAFGAAKLLLAHVDWHPMVEAAASLAAGSLLYFGVLAALRDPTLLHLCAYFLRVHPGLAGWRLRKS
jgi:putative peptidoglycan lipid II flippase